ncbi:hypothetical protein HID58_064268 [Brassica napus]|uniref:Transcription factor CBF/NF-Y/archaeal histone domain-containing protein n=1 Tax=Brassica napus TaxID=3708 RepID=A0ABQ7Z9H2_BRANA|nr:hypothetical protein HID58_064268 [Brassica napus]
MVSSKKRKSDGVNKGDGLNARSSGSKSKKNSSNKANLKDAAKKDAEVHEISESSSSEGRRDEPKESNGGVVVSEDAKMIRFPMNRIRRIMRSDNSAPQIIMQDAVFLVNKATELFIERFSEEAYGSSVKDKKKFIHYKHLSSVVSNEERYEFLADCVPEKLKAEVALEEWERSMTDLIPMASQTLLYDTNGVQEHQESIDERVLVTTEKGLTIETIQENDEDIDAETLQEPMREANKAAFDWFISSPQLDHMKISFSPSETLPGSDLKMKSSFQLVPETTAGADSDKDSFVIMMETFPKTTVDVFALVLESGGSKSHDSVLSKPLNTTQNAICVLLPEYDNLGRLLTTALLVLWVFVGSNYGGRLGDFWESNKPLMLAQGLEITELDEELPGHKLSNSGNNNMLIFWDVLAPPNKLEIWCAEVSLERHKETCEIRGNILSFSILPQWLTRVTGFDFFKLTTSSKTASTMETESESDLQDYRSCAFDSRSGGEKLKGAFTPSRFTQGPRTIASVLSETPLALVEIVETDALKLETGEAPEVMETKAELKKHIQRQIQFR